MYVIVKKNVLSLKDDAAIARNYERATFFHGVFAYF